jgi:hypothetical protein
MFSRGFVVVSVLPVARPALLAYSALLLAAASSVAAQCGKLASVDLSWHALNAPVVNHLTSVINGTVQHISIVP